VLFKYVKKREKNRQRNYEIREGGGGRKKRVKRLVIGLKQR